MRIIPQQSHVSNGKNQDDPYTTYSRVRNGLLHGVLIHSYSVIVIDIKFIIGFRRNLKEISFSNKKKYVICSYSVCVCIL